MTLAAFLEQKRLLEENIKISIEAHIEAFQETTDYCPNKIEIEMLNFNLSQGKKERYKVGKVATIIKI